MIIPSLVSVAFVVDREALGQVIRFFPVSTIPPMLFNHISLIYYRHCIVLPVDGVDKTTLLKLASSLPSTFIVLLSSCCCNKYWQLSASINY